MSAGERVRQWGSTPSERLLPLPCDDALADANEAYHRAVDVAADPAVVFRWLCQLRAAPYSYDWIDNFGRRSPVQLTPGLEALEIGQRFMSVFELVHFEQGRSLTLKVRHPGMFPPTAVTYAALAEGQAGCRLLVRLALHYRSGFADRVTRALLPFGDWIMMRRQLLNLKRLAEGT